MSNPTETFDPKKRRLCPDGACIGVLDDVGRCKVCGKVSGHAATSTQLDPSTAHESTDFNESGAQGLDLEPAEVFDPYRTLCPDGACLGVIGSDGRCSVCKRSTSTGDVAANASCGGPAN